MSHRPTQPRSSDSAAGPPASPAPAHDQLAPLLSGLQALLLITIAIVLVYLTAATSVTRADRSWIAAGFGPLYAVLAAAAAGLAAAHALNRAGRFGASADLTVLVLAGGNWLAIILLLGIPGPVSEHVRIGANFLLVSVLASSLFRSLRHTVTLAALHLAGIALLGVSVPPIDMLGFVNTGLYLAIMAIVICGASYIQARNQAQIARQQAELRAANEQLLAGVTSLEQRTRDMALLHDLSDTLQRCRTVAEVYAAAPAFAQQLLPHASGALAVRNGDPNRFLRAATWGRAPAERWPAAFAADECLALARRAAHLSGAGDDCAHLTGDAGARVICVPMLAHGQALGVLQLTSERADDFGAERLPIATMLADAIALALASLELRETLRRESVRDALTGLYNRRYLEETLSREISRAAQLQRPMCVIMLDLDHFKSCNDTFGHAAGDAVLRRVGRFLLDELGETDIACRYGGEEFTLILPETSLEAACVLAESLRQGVKALRIEHDGRWLSQVTLSFGIAAFPRHGETGAALMQRADAALYRAKREGRDRVVVGNH